MATDPSLQFEALPLPLHHQDRNEHFISQQDQAQSQRSSQNGDGSRHWPLTPPSGPRKSTNTFGASSPNFAFTSVPCPTSISSPTPTPPNRERLIPGGCKFNLRKRQSPPDNSDQTLKSPHKQSAEPPTSFPSGFKLGLRQPHSPSPHQSSPHDFHFDESPILDIRPLQSHTCTLPHRSSFTSLHSLSDLNLPFLHLTATCDQVPASVPPPEASFLDMTDGELSYNSPSTQSPKNAAMAGDPLIPRSTSNFQKTKCTLNSGNPVNANSKTTRDTLPATTFSSPTTTGSTSGARAGTPSRSRKLNKSVPRRLQLNLSASEMEVVYDTWAKGSSSAGLGTSSSGCGSAGSAYVVGNGRGWPVIADNEASPRPLALLNSATVTSSNEVPAHTLSLPYSSSKPASLAAVRTEKARDVGIAEDLPSLVPMTAHPYVASSGPGSASVQRSGSKGRNIFSRWKKNNENPEPLMQNKPSASSSTTAIGEEKSWQAPPQPHPPTQLTPQLHRTLSKPRQRRPSHPVTPTTPFSAPAYTSSAFGLLLTPGIPTTPSASPNKVAGNDGALALYSSSSTSPSTMILASPTPVSIPTEHTLSKEDLGKVNAFFAPRPKLPKTPSAAPPTPFVTSSSSPSSAPASVTRSSSQKSLKYVKKVHSHSNSASSSHASASECSSAGSPPHSSIWSGTPHTAPEVITPVTTPEPASPDLTFSPSSPPSSSPNVLSLISHEPLRFQRKRSLRRSPSSSSKRSPPSSHPPHRESEEEFTLFFTVKPATKHSRRKVVVHSSSTLDNRSTPSLESISSGATLVDDEGSVDAIGAPTATCSSVCSGPDVFEFGACGPKDTEFEMYTIESEDEEGDTRLRGAHKGLKKLQLNEASDPEKVQVDEKGLSLDVLSPSVEDDAQFYCDAFWGQ
ncbi:hypothetical protein BDN72DRAFT_892431 [Pluteus cervinus]|uniref:Uncharacterized protein n=1 Tax=Pluteus cervinus TaxID=181527 RepID=A0ACD3BBT6_9AGAR|nr:hypothetical protein BDN72DRAFT_892431 [Pluteus cervinus]